MEFCYLHPTLEASGQCSGCGNWICDKDYALLKEGIGVESKLVNNKSNNGFRSRFQRGPKIVTRKVTGPVIYCIPCYQGKTGDTTNSEVVFGSLSMTKGVRKKKILMCTQCGEKLSECDNFCPSCGDSTQDELFDASNP